MEIFTIGSSGRDARSFFDALALANVTSVVDIRRNPNSQLAGFSKADNLQFFCPKILGVPYLRELVLAPSNALLRPYKAGLMDWTTFEKNYLDEMKTASIEKIEFQHWGMRPVLLCSEFLPEKCHRTLAVKEIRRRISSVSRVEHLI